MVELRFQFMKDAKQPFLTKCVVSFTHGYRQPEQTTLLKEAAVTKCVVSFPRSVNEFNQLYPGMTCDSFINMSHVFHDSGNLLESSYC